MKALTTALYIILFGTGIAAADGLGIALDRAGDLLETGKPDSAAVILFDVLDSLDDGDIDKDSRVRAFFYLSRAMGQLGRYADEINYLILACDEGFESDHADRVRLAYAEILLESGNYDECIVIARDFRDHFPDSPYLPEMLYTVGNAYLGKEDYLRASNSFSEILRNHPGTEVAQESVMKEGICLYNLELISGAIERLELYLAQTPQGLNRSWALYYLGQSYERISQPLQAAQSYRRLVIDFPAHPETMNIMFKLGMMFFNANEMASAENAFENFVFNALPSDDRRDEARLYLERIKFRTGEYSSESDIAEHFVAKYPDSPMSPGLLFDLARYYRTMGKTDDAVEKYEILMNNPRYATYADSAAILIADTFDAAKHRDKAVMFLIRTAEEGIYPLRTQRMYLKLGQLNEAWNEFDEAIGWYDRALAVNASPDLSFRALWGIGRTFKTLNRWFEASKTLERVIAEYPKHQELIDVYMALSDVYFLQGRLRDSISSAEKAVTLADNRRKNEILLFIAELYEEIDDDHALKLYSFVYSNKTISSEYRTKALMQFGDLALRKGNRRAALTAYNRVLSEGADSIAVMEAKDRLARIGVNESDINPRRPRQ